MSFKANMIRTGISGGALGKPKRIIVHWTAGNYLDCYDRYHFCVPFDKETRKIRIVQMLSMKTKGSHIRNRNTGSIGISMCGMGPKSPIQPEQIEACSKMIAELCIVYDIPLSEVYDHAYFAKLDGYYPDRWDIGSLWTDVRSKMIWYHDKLKKGEIEAEYTKVLF